MTEVHPNISVCGEKEARELLFSSSTKNENNTNRFSRILAIGFPSAPFTDEEIALLATTVRLEYIRSFVLSREVMM
jgi:hypothetical protein